MPVLDEQGYRALAAGRKVMYLKAVECLLYIANEGPTGDAAEKAARDTLRELDEDV